MFPSMFWRYPSSNPVLQDQDEERQGHGPHGDHRASTMAPEVAPGHLQNAHQSLRMLEWSAPTGQQTIEMQGPFPRLPLRRSMSSGRMEPERQWSGAPCVLFLGAIENLRCLSSPAHAQRFLHVHGVSQNLFRVGRHLVRSVQHRMLRARSFTVWAEATAA